MGGGKITGCAYLDAEGMDQEIKGAVVLATGGYGGDLSEKSLLAKNVPKVLADKENSVSDERTNGSGIKIAIDAGAGTERLDQVNFYPLACSGPNMESDRFKFVLSTS